MTLLSWIGITREQSETVSEVQTTAAPRMELKTIGRLIMRTWPYYRPQLKHLITYASLNVLMGVFLLVGPLIGNELINNKVLLGERVQPL